MKILQNNVKNKKYIESLPKLYIVALWAHWGVRDFPFSGKFDSKSHQPLVWNYNDHNGTADQFELVPLYWVTSGFILTYMFNETYAEMTASALNKCYDSPYDYWKEKEDENKNNRRI